MPILDYQERANWALKRLNLNPKISSRNKSYVKEYFKAVPVSAARAYIRADKLPVFLIHSKDLKMEMHDKTKINSMFAKVRKHYPNISSYTSVANCVIALARWLNDNERPKGFMDIKRSGRMKRKLDEDELTLWKEGLELIKREKSPQIKAAFMVQLGEGLRPSEFIDLNYGDCKPMDDLINIKIRDGKTGPRDCPCYRSVPYLTKWLNAHPTKKANDPLWIREYDLKSGKKGKIQRYGYPAIRKRIVEMGKKSKWKKPLDFYSLRHSSCYQDKLDNVDIELAASRHGHSTKEFLETYGTLGIKGKANKLRQAYGLEKKDESKTTNPKCQRCGHLNTVDDNLCDKCGYALNPKAAMDVAKNKSQELDEIKKRLATMESTMAKAIEQKFKRRLKKIKN